MRLIDADILDEALTALRFTADGEIAHWGDRKDWCLHGSEIEMLIANAPTIDAEPVRHGHWIMLHKTYSVDEINDYDWRCSKCNHVDCHNINVEVPYCWHCGARMDEVNDDSK